MGGLGNGRASLRRSAQRRFGSSAGSGAGPWRRPPRMAGGAFSSPADGVARSNSTNAFYSGSSTMTRRDQDERIDAPLADLRENQIDERHESCKSMHFESHKNSYWQGERWRRGSPQWLLGWSQLGIWDDLDSLRLRCARQTFASPVSSHQNSGHTRTSHQNNGQRATFPARSGSAVPRPFISGVPNPNSGKFNS